MADLFTAQSREQLRAIRVMLPQQRHQLVIADRCPDPPACLTGVLAFLYLAKRRDLGGVDQGREVAQALGVLQHQVRATGDQRGIRALGAQRQQGLQGDRPIETPGVSLVIRGGVVRFRCAIASVLQAGWPEFALQQTVSGLADRAITGAATQIAAQCMVDHGVALPGIDHFALIDLALMTGMQHRKAHGDARGAEATLAGVCADQCLLHRREGWRLAGIRQTLDGDQVTAGQLVGGHQAGVGGAHIVARPLQGNGAGAAVAGGTAFLGAVLPK